MIKRDPQEIADFFGCEVQVHPYTNSVNLWAPNGGIKEGLGYLKHKLIHRSNTADDKLTYKPQETQENSEGNSPNSENKGGPCYQDFADSDNYAPHQSEVYIEARYVLLGEFHPGTLMQKVEEYLNKGFKLYGNPWTGPDTGSAGYIHYQAMVRGLE